MYPLVTDDAFPISWRGKEAKPSGGLGAALSQYSGSVDPSLANPDVHSAKRITRISSTGQFQLDRSRTASPMFPVKGHMQDRSSLALSPMLIPPMGQVHTNSDPPDIVRQSDTGAVNSSRFLPTESRGLHSREGQGPLGLPSGSNHGDQSGGFYQPMVRSLAPSPLTFSNCPLTHTNTRIELFCAHKHGIRPSEDSPGNAKPSWCDSCPVEDKDSGAEPPKWRNDSQ